MFSSGSCLQLDKLKPFAYILAYQSIQQFIMASSLHTINADEVDSTSSQTDWGTESAFCPWISTHCPPPASFAAQRSPSIHSQYSAAIQLSPEPGPGTLITPASTQQDHGGVSWVGSSSSSQYSPSNNGTGEISWMNIIGSPEFNPPSSAQDIAQPHSTDTTSCQHHVHTQERSPTSAEYVSHLWIYLDTALVRFDMGFIPD